MIYTTCICGGGYHFNSNQMAERGDNSNFSWKTIFEIDKDWEVV